jgi:hypothetical protein
MHINKSEFYIFFIHMILPVSTFRHTACNIQTKISFFPASPKNENPNSGFPLENTSLNVFVSLAAEGSKNNPEISVVHRSFNSRLFFNSILEMMQPASLAVPDRWKMKNDVVSGERS